MRQINLWVKKQGLLGLIKEKAGRGGGGGCAQSKVLFSSLGQVDFLAGQVPLIYGSLAQGSR